jgi:hypothetical protein
MEDTPAFNPVSAFRKSKVCSDNKRASVTRAERTEKNRGKPLLDDSTAATELFFFLCSPLYVARCRDIFGMQQNVSKALLSSPTPLAKCILLLPPAFLFQPLKVQQGAANPTQLLVSQRAPAHHVRSATYLGT